MPYSELTRRHFECASHAGTLVGSVIRRGSAGSRGLGVWIQFDVRISASGPVETVHEARFLAYACPHVIAVADWLCAQVVGVEVRAALPESVASLQARFEVPVEKLGRLLMVEDAWIAAMAPPSKG